jgi:hypothetical protein
MDSLSMKNCIDACYRCAAECENCATECLKENDIKLLSRCISLDHECALICNATAQLISMNGENANLLCGVCADICLACSLECERNEELEHCRQCAEECRKCYEACKSMIAMELVV